MGSRSRDETSRNQEGPQFGVEAFTYFSPLFALVELNPVYVRNVKAPLWVLFDRAARNILSRDREQEHLIWVLVRQRESNFDKYVFVHEQALAMLEYWAQVPNEERGRCDLSLEFRV